jgi:hypothetical protein
MKATIKAVAVLVCKPQYIGLQLDASCWERRHPCLPERVSANDVSVQARWQARMPALPGCTQLQFAIITEKNGRLPIGERISNAVPALGKPLPSLGPALPKTCKALPSAGKTLLNPALALQSPVTLNSYSVW